MVEDEVGWRWRLGLDMSENKGRVSSRRGKKLRTGRNTRKTRGEGWRREQRCVSEGRIGR